MGNGRFGAALRHVETLFRQGAVGNLTDAELLGRAAQGEAEHAELAFAAIVERHGPMVLRVCRAVVRDEHDAQDAFQATFLVLVRRARAVRNHELLASWLYGVALRVAGRARSARAERTEREREAALPRFPLDPVERASIAEVVGIVHEEVGRLPARYRAPMILCYLEEQSCEAAAKQLGWPVGTVKSRLARGRDRLRSRLSKRGVGREIGPIMTVGPAPGERLSGATVNAMLHFRFGAPTGELISATAVSWAIHTLRMMEMTRLAMGSLLSLLGMAAISVAVLAGGESPEAERPKGAVPKAIPKVSDVDETASKKRSALVFVRVINARGEGVPGTTIEVFEDDRSGPRTRMHRAGADGLARIAVYPYGLTRFLARPDPQTIGWACRNPEEKKNGTTKDVPIVLELLPRRQTVEGLVVDQAGKPMAGVPVQVTSLQHARNRHIFLWMLDRVDSPLGSTKTDGAGRYRLELPEHISAGIAAMKPEHVGPWVKSNPELKTLPTITLQGAGSITGRVVQAGTGKPVADASVSASRIELDGNKLHGGRMGLSDADGRFKIDCLPPGVYELRLEHSPLGERFTAVAQEGLRIKPGVVATAELSVIEGKRVHGTVVDIASGKPLSAVPVYCTSPAHPGASAMGQITRTDSLGRFEFFVPPGLVKVHCQDRDNPMLSPWVDGPHLKTLTVVAARDPAEIALKGGEIPDDLFERHGTTTSEEGVIVRMQLTNDPPDDGSRTILGRIFDQHHQPIAAASVRYIDPKGHSIQNATDRQGLFRMKGVLRDESTLIFSKTGYRTRSYRIRPRDSEFEITLEKRG